MISCFGNFAFNFNLRHYSAAASAAVDAAEKVEGGGVKIAGRKISLALAVTAGEAAGFAVAKVRRAPQVHPGLDAVDPTPAFRDFQGLSALETKI